MFRTIPSYFSISVIRAVGTRRYMALFNIPNESTLQVVKPITIAVDVFDMSPIRVITVV
jgi:hypothetical protein